PGEKAILDVHPAREIRRISAPGEPDVDDPRIRPVLDRWRRIPGIPVNGFATIAETVGSVCPAFRAGDERIYNRCRAHSGRPTLRRGSRPSKPQRLPNGSIPATGHADLTPADPPHRSNPPPSRRQRVFFDSYRRHLQSLCHSICEVAKVERRDAASEGQLRNRKSWTVLVPWGLKRFHHLAGGDTLPRAIATRGHPRVFQ